MEFVDRATSNVDVDDAMNETVTIEKLSRRKYIAVKNAAQLGQISWVPSQLRAVNLKHKNRRNDSI